MARTGRPKAELTLTESERAQLTRAVRAASSSQAYALRCRIILASAGGMSNTQIARDLGISMPTVGKWRSRFLASRTAGLADEPRPGRAPSILLDRVEQVVTSTLETLPANATHRTRAAMAARSGPSPFDDRADLAQARPQAASAGRFQDLHRPTIPASAGSTG